MRHFLIFVTNLFLISNLILLPGNGLGNFNNFKTTFSVIDQFKEVNKRIPADRVYLHVDKSLYKPGETVWFTAYVRNSADLKKSDQSDIVHVELYDPNNNMINHIRLIAKDGASAGDFLLDENWPGGIYTIKAYTNWQKNDKNALLYEKKITLQQVILPRLIMKLDFKKKGFGPGDIASANLSLKTLINEPLSEYEFNYTVQLNSSEYIRKIGQTDNKGEAIIKFQLPENLDSNDGLLNVVINHNGNTESVSKSIPITLNTIQFEMYPEGGDIIAGFNNRIAFQALDEKGKPCDIEGLVLDKDKDIVTTFKSFHKGMGAFWLAPDINQEYQVKITKPKNILQTHLLPRILSHGITLNVEKTENSILKTSIKSSFSEEIRLIGQIRGKVYLDSSLTTKEGVNTIYLNCSKMPAGVLQLTVFNNKNYEEAERLVFVNKHRQMNINISTDKEIYMPREKVKMEVFVTDENNKPIEANLSLAVVDDKLISLADDKSGNILSKLLLEADITGDVDEPSFYFDPEEPNADQALDFLLMTRGWRRFSWQEIKNFNIDTLFANEKAVISGHVYDQKNKMPLAKVSVKIKETDIETKTDQNGNFELYNVCLSEPQIIEFVKRGKQRQSFYITEYNQNLRVCFHSNMLKGRVKDPSTNEAIPFANIIVEKDGAIVTGGMSDFDGNYTITPVPSGIYTVRCTYVGYESEQVEKVPVTSEEVTFLDFDLDAGVTISEVMIYSSPMISADDVSVSRILTTEEIKKMPGRSADVIASTVAGVYSENGKIMNIRGAREEGNAYYIDGVRVIGSRMLPKTAIRDITVITGGIPAKYGDVTGGIIDVQTYSYMDNTNYDWSYDEIYNNFDSYYSKPPVPEARYYKAREYPEIVYKSIKKVSKREDFRTTVFWDGNIKTNSDGKATVKFYNSDDITTFKTIVEGISHNGLTGRAEQNYAVQSTFSIDAKVPITALFDDEIKVQVNIYNNANYAISGNLFFVIPKAWKLQTRIPKSCSIEANSFTAVELCFKVESIPGKDTFEIGFEGDGIKESLLKDVEVFPIGFPTTVSFSGNTKSEVYNFDISSPVEGSLEAQFTAYPTMISELLSGIESLIREPYGCFEQVSSATYPNILVLNYLNECDSDEEDVKEKAKRLIEQGYNKLAAYETPTGGFDWYGKSPGSLSLSAYGLLEFSDMKKVHDIVSDKMIENTKKWILERSDGNGGFIEISSRYGFGYADPDITNAYVVWALAESETQGIDKEVNHIYNQALQSTDPYLIGLSCNALFAYDLNEKAEKLLKKLCSYQQEKGQFKGALHSITRSTGNSLDIETTAFAILALLESSNINNIVLTKSVDWLLSQRSSYGKFGSTQGTVMALKAITAFARYSKRTSEDGLISLYVDDKLVTQLKYEKDQKGSLSFEDLEQFLSEGNHKIKVEYSDVKKPLPYSLGINWTSRTPSTASNAPLQIETEINQQAIELGENLRLSIQLTNKTDKGLPSSIAIVGIPGGLSLQPWQLKELQENETFDYYEIVGDELILYYRQMLPEEIREINLDLKSEIKGTYEGIASRAYLYYTDENKYWTAGEKVVIN
jgi:hypothetical protein